MNYTSANAHTTRSTPKTLLSYKNGDWLVFSALLLSSFLFIGPSTSVCKRTHIWPCQLRFFDTLSSSKHQYEVFHIELHCLHKYVIFSFRLATRSSFNRPLHALYKTSVDFRALHFQYVSLPLPVSICSTRYLSFFYLETFISCLLFRLHHI